MSPLKSNQKGVSAWAIIIVLACMVVAIIVAFWPQVDLPEDNMSPVHIRLWQETKSVVGNIGENVIIEKWIVDNKLNEYGESAKTLYTGGTPLFDERTGETMDRYDYIRQHHPDKPWNKVK